MALFQPYAPEKAAISRWALGISATALFAFGAYQFFNWAPESWHGAIGGWAPFGDEFPISPALLIAVVFFLVGAGGTWWASNYPRLVDFFVDTEAEMGKVSWSSWKEVWGSSIVVIVTVVILGVWILVVDLLLDVHWGERVRAVYHAIFG